MSSKDRSLKHLVTDLKDNTGLLARQEIALVKAKAKEKVAGVARKAALFGAAGVLAYAGLLVLLAAAILVIIALGVVAWLATLIVGASVLVAAFLIVQRARRPSPEAHS